MKSASFLVSFFYRRLLNAHSLLPLLLALVLTGCGPRQTPREATEGFFKNIAAKQYQEAFDAAAFAFQSQTSLNSFRATARELELAPPLTFRWLSEDTGDPQETKLTGEIASGEKRTVFVVSVIRERGAWRIFSVGKVRPDGKKATDLFSLLGKEIDFNNTVNQEVPPLAEVKKLIKASLLLFNEGLQKRSFTDFYAQEAAIWQNQMSAHQLRTAFQPFIDAKVNLQDIQTMEPVFDTPPVINSTGLLEIKGHYDTSPVKLYFSLLYAYEIPYWKICGLDVQLR